MNQAGHVNAPPSRSAGDRPSPGSRCAADHDGERGYVHSELTGSALDGPGLRTVFWLSGCEFRCAYCHNPDTWNVRNGRLRTADEVLAELSKYARFMRTTGGGLTLSGGEPLVQHRFCKRILNGAHALGIHTALDTNGFLGKRLSDADLLDVDLVLLDVKSWDARTHLQVTGRQNEPVVSFARRLHALARPVWIRFVLVPGLTDAPENVRGLARFCGTLKNVERVEVLPFHQLGRYKWRELGITYSLDSVAPPSPELLSRTRALFREHGLNCPG